MAKKPTQFYGQTFKSKSGEIYRIESTAPAWQDLYDPFADYDPRYTGIQKYGKHWSLKGTDIRKGSALKYSTPIQDQFGNIPIPKMKQVKDRSDGPNLSWSRLFNATMSQVPTYLEDIASTDRVKTRQTIYQMMSSTASITTMAAGAPELSLLINAFNVVFGNYMTNSIQRNGDMARVRYNFNNMDHQKYGTYAYDNTSQEWVAQDSNKIVAKVLNKNTCV